MARTRPASGPVIEASAAGAPCPSTAVTVQTGLGSRSSVAAAENATSTRSLLGGVTLDGVGNRSQVSTTVPPGSPATVSYANDVVNQYKAALPSSIAR